MEIVKSLQNQRILKYILLVFIGSMILTVSAKIKVPFYPVPMTMQTFVVIFIGMTYGWKLGLATVSVYLLEGAFGFPVFAGTPEKGMGIAYMLGPTGGYLLGFLVAVFIAGFVNLKKNILVRFFLITIAIATIYLFGVPWLAYLKGWQIAYVWGIKKFLLAELFKIGLLTLIARQSLKLRKFI